MGFGSSAFGSGSFGSWLAGSGTPDPDTSDGVKKVDDVCAHGLARLIEQYKKKPRIEAILCALLDEVQEIEDAEWDLYTRRSIASAEGAQLDVLGAIVGRPRAGLDDEDYRAWIAAQIAANRSAGTAPELLHILRLIYGDTQDVELQEWWPAELTVTLHEMIEHTPAVILAILRQAKSGGVRLILEYTHAARGETFEFASAVTPAEYDDALGYGSTVDATLGGSYAAAVE